jgi:hypothetical protein
MNNLICKYCNNNCVECDVSNFKCLKCNVLYYQTINSELYYYILSSKYLLKSDNVDLTNLELLMLNENKMLPQFYIYRSGNSSFLIKLVYMKLGSCYSVNIINYSNHILKNINPSNFDQKLKTILAFL